MKKFLAMMLAVLMLLSMATVAFADGDVTPPQTGNSNTVVANGGSFTLRKVYTGSAYAPKETFKFTAVKATNNPTAEGFNDVVTVIHDPDDTTLTNSYGKITVSLPTYQKVGTYTYTITEDDSTTKGLVKDSTSYTLVVQVVNTTDSGFKCEVYMYKGTPANKNKVDYFDNAYQYGTLAVSKTVDGFFDQEKDAEYKFTITLTEETVNNVTYTGKYYKTVDGNLQQDGNATVNIQPGANTDIMIKNGQTLKIEGLPTGAGYTVEETTPLTTVEGHNGKASVTYSPAATDDKVTGTITGTTGETSSVSVTNKFEYKGKLVVEKVVTGYFGDMLNDEFTFNISGLKIANIDESASTLVSKTDTETGCTVVLKHGGKVTFKDLPYGTSYAVTEQPKDQYNSTPAFYEYNSDNREVSGAKTEGSIDQATEKYVFTNENKQNIETGVSLDTLPYVLVLALAGAGLVLMIARKRRVED